MTTITTLLIDDEKPARRALRSLLARDREIEIVGEAADGEHALDLIRRQHPRLVFLDVQMPMLNGIEVLQQLAPGERPEVIFVTAYDEHAVAAFELHAIDYVLKPFGDARFYSALDRAKKRLQSASLAGTEQALRALLEQLQTPRPASAGSPVPSSRLVVKSDGELHFLNQRDVRWIEGQGDYVKIHLRDRGLMVRSTLNRIERSLDPALFARIHKSTIVNLANVRRVVPVLARSRGMELDTGTVLPIGASYRAVLDRLT